MRSDYTLASMQMAMNVHPLRSIEKIGLHNQYSWSKNKLNQQGESRLKYKIA